MTQVSPREASRFVKAAVALAFAVAVLGLWIYGSARVPNYILPSPRAVLDTAISFFNSPRSLGHLFSTLTVVGISITLSFCVGALLALSSYYVSWLRPLIDHRLTPFLNSFSGVGWTLLATIWFGVTRETVIFAISIILLPFAIINLTEGLATQDVEFHEMARSFARSRLRIFFQIIVPALLPFIVATLRIMFGVSWKVAMTAELFGGSSGLGYMLNLARQDYDTATIFVLIALIILFVYLADHFFFLPIEKTMAKKFGAAR
jgi:NitT/TauT family transport system permease protein